MRDNTAGTLRKLRDGAGGTVGAVLWEPSLTAGLANGQPDRLLSYPVYTDPNVASLASNARVMAFGDFNAYYVRTVGDITVELDRSRYFDTDQTGIRARWRVDGDLVDFNAIRTLVRNV
jgi:HK97 family phage major capsid protein